MKIYSSSGYQSPLFINSNPVITGVPTLDLTNTADLTTWLTKYSGTYTCGTNWSVQDFEGKFNPVRTNIAPFYGARRVENICLSSQDLTGAAWSTASATVLSATTGIATLQYGSIRQASSIITIEGHLYRISFKAKTDGRKTGFKFAIHNSASGSSAILGDLTDSYRVYSNTFLGRIGGGVVSCGIRDDNTSDWVEFCLTDMMVEEVTGQANQNPSNHIATTSAAVTEYYTTENGNTVSSNVVTEATGAEITSTIGMAFHPTTKNEIPANEYRDFSHANWIKTNGSITAGDVVLIDGTTVADKNTFTASAANATIIKTAYVSAAGVHAGGLWVKRKTGTGAIEVTVDNGATWVAVTTQVAGDSGWHLCQTTLPTVTDPQVGVRLVIDTDSVYFDWAQLDDGYAEVSDSPIVGAATVTQPAFQVSDAMNAAKLISDAKGYVIVYARLPNDLSIVGGKLIENGEDVLYIKSGDNDASSNDGTNTLEYNNSVVGLTKIASYWGHETDKKQLSAGGSSSATGNYDGAFGAGAITAGEAHNGILTKLIFGYNIKTTQAKMEAETT